MKTKTFRSESALQRAIVVALRQRGFWVVRRGYKQRRGKTMPQSGEPGEPDLELRALGHIEVKMPGETLTPAQVHWHTAAKQLGLRVWTVDTVEEAIEVAEMWFGISNLTRTDLIRIGMMADRVWGKRRAA